MGIGFVIEKRSFKEWKNLFSELRSPDLLFDKALNMVSIAILVLLISFSIWFFTLKSLLFYLYFTLGLLILVLITAPFLFISKDRFYQPLKGFSHSNGSIEALFKPEQIEIITTQVFDENLESKATKTTTSVIPWSRVIEAQETKNFIYIVTKPLSINNRPFKTIPIQKNTLGTGELHDLKSIIKVKIDSYRNLAKSNSVFKIPAKKILAAIFLICFLTFGTCLYNTDYEFFNRWAQYEHKNKNTSLAALLMKKTTSIAKNNKSINQSKKYYFYYITAWLLNMDNKPEEALKYLETSKEYFQTNVNKNVKNKIIKLENEINKKITSKDTNNTKVKNDEKSSPKKPLNDFKRSENILDKIKIK